MSHSLFAAINIGKKNAALDEETYRDLLNRETGKRSLRAMSFKELNRVRDALYVSSLDQTKSKTNSKRLTGPYAKKLQALWISAWNLGIVRDRRDPAMLAFIKRQTGIERTEFLREAEAAKKVVEALKSWIAREGGVCWGAERDGEVPDPQDAVIHAQLDILNRKQVGLRPGKKAKIELMNILGVQIRADKAGRAK